MSENVIEEVVIPEVACTICGGHTFNKKFAAEGMYMCRSIVNGKLCDHVQYLCKTCNKIRDESRFGKHGDVWECKECGTVCWPCTDRMLTIEEYKRLMSSVSSFMNSLNL